MDGIRITVDVNSVAIENKVQSLIDETLMLRVHNLLAKMCDPYVPMDEGVLAQTLEITPQYVRYLQPYAHYMYVGAVYGPNIPIIKDGYIVGWFSPPGQPKHPTGKAIQYSAEKHPLASREWDKAMMRDRGDDFTQQVKNLLIQRARELYG